VREASSQHRCSSAIIYERAQIRDKKLKNHNNNNNNNNNNKNNKNNNNNNNKTNKKTTATLGGTVSSTVLETQYED